MNLLKTSLLYILQYCMSYDTRIADDSEVVSESSSLKPSSSSTLYTDNIDHVDVQILLPEQDHGLIPPQMGGYIEDELPDVQNTNSENNFLRRMSPNIIRRMSINVIKIIPTTTLQIMSKTWIWNLTMFLSYVICISLFPSITALVESTNSNKVRMDEYLIKTFY